MPPENPCRFGPGRRGDGEQAEQAHRVAQDAGRTQASMPSMTAVFVPGQRYVTMRSCASASWVPVGASDTTNTTAEGLAQSLPISRLAPASWRSSYTTPLNRRPYRRSDPQG